METINLQDCKKYLGVIFEGYGKSNDVIPKSWISKWNSKSRKCRWPNSDKDVVRLAKNGSDPDDSWKTYNIRVLCHATTYDRCVVKLYDISSLGGASSSCEPNSSHAEESCVERSSLRNAVYKTPLVHVPAQNSNEVLAKLSAMKEEFDISLKEVIRQQKILGNKLDVLVREVFEKSAAKVVLGPPAENQDELEELLKSEVFLDTIKIIKGSKPNDTARMIIRRIMTKTLAQHFSLTGLGKGRKHTKINFKAHAICNPVTERIMASHKISQAEAFACVRDVFKGVPDWDCCARQRKKKVPDAREDDLGASNGRPSSSKDGSSSSSKDGSSSSKDGSSSSKDGSSSSSKDGSSSSKDGSSSSSKDGSSSSSKDGSSSSKDGSSSSSKNGPSSIDSPHCPVDSLHSLKDGSHSLKDGSHSLKDGSHSLKDGSHSLKDGSHSLKDGSHSLKDGSHSSESEVCETGSESEVCETGSESEVV